MSDFVDDFYNQAWRDLMVKPDIVDEGVIVSDVVKEYKDMLQIVIYHNDYYLPKNKKSSEHKRLEKLERQLDSSHRSLRRSSVAIQDIIISNNWDYWCTFTFSPNKVDRHDFNKVSAKMHLWLKRQRGLRYIIVPEKHKNGAFHFHALIANYTGQLRLTDKKTKYGQSIYNANFGSGFHEFVKLDDNKEAIAKYMIKQYVTKSDLKLFGRKRYWTSRGLDRPISHVNGLTRFKLWSLVKQQPPVYVNDFLEIHHVPKPFALDSEAQSRLAC